MNGIKIITDCTSDLTPELYEKHDIDIIPLYVNIGGKSYADVIEINAEQLYQLVKEHGELPKTSAIPPATFTAYFKKYLDAGKDILYLGIGSGFSAAFQNARIAASEFPEGRIRLVDSGNLSSGIGLLLLKAAQYRNQGADLETIARKVEADVSLVRTQFAINTLSYLHKGGRCSGTSRIIGTLLKIKPIIRVVDGKMVVTKKPRGKFQKALDTLVDYLRSDAEKVDLDNIMVTHNLAKEDAAYLKREIAKVLNPIQIHETKASAVISTHCGPRTIGILYMVKK
ncbi:MAG TPA: DegV family protein [Acholeplasmataceae bacterium]|jgi:DegV family protein with EDD domain|nr:DegV family protein [Acholeplasmataceae bacterium]